MKLYELPEIEPRRPYAEDQPEGYLESDRDFVTNNLEACVWFLENHAKLQELVTRTCRLIGLLEHVDFDEIAKRLENDPPKH